MLKKVIVETQKGFKMFGKCIRNGEENTFNIRQIFTLIGMGKGTKVFEVLPNGELLRLNKDNYDKVNSSVPSVAKTEVDHKEPENIDEGIPTRSDESSNEDKVETTEIVEEPSEVVEEPDTIEEEKEPVIENTDSEVKSDEAPVESTVEAEEPMCVPTEEPGTNENEESIVETDDEEAVNDSANEEVVEVTEETAESEQVKPAQTNNYNIPKKGSKYYKK